MTISVVGVSGTLHEPSKTTALVHAIARSFSRRAGIDFHLIEISALGADLGAAMHPGQASPALADAIARVQTADLIIAATPVYRGSYTGLFKHLFDLVSQSALAEVPVFVAATGGSERHSLVLEHELRPLFAFFEALILPVGIYAQGPDFDADGAPSAELLERIDHAVDRAVPIIQHRLIERAATS